MHSREDAEASSRFDKFIERACRALTLAQEEAHALRHHCIGTEHLLLGLLRERHGVAVKVIANLGAEEGEIDLPPKAKKALDAAVNEARRCNHQDVAMEHALLGLLLSPGIASDVLPASASVTTGA